MLLVLHSLLFATMIKVHIWQSAVYSFEIKTPYTLGCPSKHKMSQIEFLMGDMLCLYVGDPRKKIQSFISIFDQMRSTFVFWTV